MDTFDSNSNFGTHPTTSMIIVINFHKMLKMMKIHLRSAVHIISPHYIINIITKKLKKMLKMMKMHL